MKVQRLAALVALLTAVSLNGTRLNAHVISFNSTVAYSSSQPTGAVASLSNWIGAAFDAGNIGGSGVNADGGANNGTANDSFTYFAGGRGQTFTTGGAANGYDVASITVRMAGYTNNVATGTNRTSWNLNAENGPVIIQIGRVTGTAWTSLTRQLFIAGGTGHPGSGTSSNGPGTYITFHLPFTTHLEPNTTYGFEVSIGNVSNNEFEWLGINSDVYAGGTAYSRSGTTVTPLVGDRVFQIDMVASANPTTPFLHPGTLHTPADLARMAAKVTANAQPWKASYEILADSPWAQTWWPAYNVDYIVRGPSGNNYTRSQQDAQAIYELALRWHITGNTAYADKAVEIANVWSDLLGVTGDSNLSLAAGICGYLFAIGGDLLSTYPGWVAADKQAYNDMMMRVFYPANLDFLWRHHDTFWREGGNTHYRLNWETANMASMAAIGILCDNRAVYEQALDFFKFGPGNGRVERAAWYLHSDGLAQSEESGRDQPHNLGGWHAMALLCQMAWNQGDDLFGYDNSRVLRAFEYNAKYNLGFDVPAVPHRNTDLGYTETLSGAGRGIDQYYHYELVYNHYVHVKGIAAPWGKLAVDATRPEPRPDPGIHPSLVDWLGLGSLTFARDPIVTNAPPSGLRAHWTKNAIRLHWWGSAYATNYNVQRATVAGGPYTTVGVVGALDTTFKDTNVANGVTYHYVVSALTPAGETNSAELAVQQSLVAHYTFEGNANDVVGTRHGTLLGGSSGGPSFTTGKIGQAALFDGANDYVRLPTGMGNYRDITLGAWVYWNGGGNFQRVFDFGSEIEKSMFLTPRSGAGTIQFHMTTTRGTDGSVWLDGPALPMATWTHVAVTLNGDTATLYVNGVPVDAEVADVIDPLFGQPFCYLGRSMWNGDPYFSGRIDDFRIYSYALSGADVYALWGQSTNAAPLFTSDPITKAAANEDAAYLGQTLATNATDANGGSLTFSKVTGPAWLNVATNGALSGVPSNSDVGENLFVVRVKDAVGATDDANLYITVINTNDAPTWLVNPITQPEVTRGLAYAGTLAGAATDIDAGDSFTFSKVSGPSWLVVSTNGTLSGTPSGSDAGVNSFTVRVTDSFGATNDATLLIDVLPYSLRHHYEFESNADDRIAGRNGTASGSPVYANGRFGQAIVLDGTNDYVTLPGSFSALVFQDITIAAWVFWNGGSQWQRIFDFGDDTTEYLHLTPRSGANTLRFAIKDGGAEQTMSTTQLATSQWVHVAVTLGGDTGRLYVNGVLRVSDPAVTINPSDFTPAVNYIGNSQFSADPLFSGLIDDFRIYNYALSAAEITNLLTIVPEAPNGLLATSGDNAVTLAWNASANASGYHVKRATVSGGPYTIIASNVAALAFTNYGLTPGTPYFYVVSAVNANGESANSMEASASAVIVISPTIISVGAVWRYFDKTNDLGTSWRSNAFNDAAWSNGTARLGFGNDGEVTKIASNRQWTTYFRREFFISNPTNVTALDARVTRDDAAVVFLNGAEVWRDTNITSGIITNQTPALSALSGTNETNWLSFSLPLTNLVAGWNLLAAEVHQQSLTSSDLGFNFELNAEAFIRAQPMLNAVTQGNAVAISWARDDSFFALYTATNLSPPIAWSRITNVASLSNDQWIITFPTATNRMRFFRLQSD